MEICEERETICGISERNEVLDPRDLKVGSGKLHLVVPRELRLSVEERIPDIVMLVEKRRHAQVGRPHPNSDTLIVGGGPERIHRNRSPALRIGMLRPRRQSSPP